MKLVVSLAGRQSCVLNIRPTFTAELGLAGPSCFSGRLAEMGQDSVQKH
jgi:hypothetical protein